MQIEVNGTRLWFDVDGLALVPDGDAMRQRPSLVLLHGGPGAFDHTYFKPHFTDFSAIAQVIYLDLRDHGRSARHDAAAWSFQVCADDVRAFCDAIGLVRPIVLGHSMGGFVAILYGACHPGHAGGLILQSTAARFDLGRLVRGFRRVAGDEVAALARRDYGGEDISAAEWTRVFAAFGPRVPSDDELARRIRNPDLAKYSTDLLQRFDVVDRLGLITSPTLVCVGELDPVTPPEASQEIVDGLRSGIGRLEVLEGAGHFPWLDSPDAYRSVLTHFIEAAAGS